MEVEITWKRTLPIWWAYFWRNIMAVVASIMVGSFVGLIIGFILDVMGIWNDTMNVVCRIIGTVIGLAFSVVPMKMILGKKFGNYRLVLVSADVIDTKAFSRPPDDRA